MKICWDNLEDVKLSEYGNLVINKHVYIEIEACKVCGNPYLTIKSGQSEFCGQSCAISGENHPNYGKPRPVETRKKIALSHIGKTHSVESRQKMSRSASGILNWNYKGGISSLGLVAYINYKDTLGLYEDLRKQKNTEILEVRCAYCGRWHAPSATAVSNRLIAINNLNQGERRLYCSENCKMACPIYNRTKYPKGFKHTTSREVSPYLRQMVFERDSWTCQICGKTIAECQLHCHHMDPVSWNPMFQNDMDSCITLCKGCHKMVHSRKGCRYVDLQCKRPY